MLSMMKTFGSSVLIGTGKNVIDDEDIWFWFQCFDWYRLLSMMTTFGSNVLTGKNVIDDEDLWFHVLIGTGKNVIDDDDLWFQCQVRMLSMMFGSMF